MHPESESKVISLGERAKVTEALEAILAEIAANPPPGLRETDQAESVGVE